MQVSLKDLMDKMGVGRELGPYETQPWSCYDGDKGITCSAEVRMGPDGNEIEAEAQMMYDTPPEGKAPMEQVCHIHALPAKDGQWGVTALRIRGEPFGEGIYDWESKCCDFFSALVQNLIMDEIPDIDELIDDAFHNNESFHDQDGGGGGKSPKIRPSQLLDIKKGKGF